MRSADRLSDFARSTKLVLFALTLLATPGGAAEGPTAVSPGDTAKLVQVAASCPTFSWGWGGEAESYELLVYRVDKQGEQGEHGAPVLRKSLPGTARSWTPALDQCLERGGRYAWSVRAATRTTRSEWSPPGLFEVAAAPGYAELRAELDEVKSQLEDEALGATGATPVATQAPVAQATAMTPSTPGASAAPANTQLSVDGNIHATSFTGDGSNLTGLGPDGPCFSATHRFVDCSNGTVTDTVSGLIYLENADCFGLQNWATANRSAAGLADGACGLTDGSRPGDWRLATPDEWQGILTHACSEPTLVGNQSPTPACYNDAGDPDSEWASGVRGFYWSSTTYDDTTKAIYAEVRGGANLIADKSALAYVWPVRSSQ